MQTFRKLPTMQPRIKNTTDQNSNGTAAQRLAEGSVSEMVILPGNESGSRLLQRFEGSVGAQAHALTAPFDVVAEKCQEPKGSLQEVLDRDQPRVAPGRRRGRLGRGRASAPASPILRRCLGSRGRSPSVDGGVVQSLLKVQGADDSDEPAEEGASQGGCAGLDDEPEERPEGSIAQEAEEVGHGLAHANRARPAELMLPDGGPSHRR